MKKRFSKAQIAFALRQASSGTLVAETTRKMGITEQTFYWWKKQYAVIRPGEDPIAIDSKRIGPGFRHARIQCRPAVSVIRGEKHACFCSSGIEIRTILQKAGNIGRLASSTEPNDGQRTLRNLSAQTRPVSSSASIPASPVDEIEPNKTLRRRNSFTAHDHFLPSA